MKPTVKYSLLITAVIIVGFVVYMKNSSKDEMASAPKTAPAKEAPVASAPVLPKENGEMAKNVAPPLKKDLPSNPYLSKESIAALPPTMKEFLMLDMKSIKNQEETKDFFELLRSPAAIEDAQKILLSVKLDNLEESEREHLAATRFLAKALGDMNNKSNRNLKAIVKEIILKDNLSSVSMPEQARMILAGDKAELIHTFIAFNQNGHKELLGSTKNPNIKRIVENAYAYNESMRMGR